MVLSLANLSVYSTLNIIEHKLNHHFGFSVMIIETDTPHTLPGREEIQLSPG